MAEHTSPTLPTLVQRFFLDHLGEQRAVSAQTVAAYVKLLAAGLARQLDPPSAPAHNPALRIIPVMHTFP